VVDLAAAREAQPEAQLPRESAYPGGRTRVAAQIASAIATHAARFGAPPRGMWPAEGAISSPLLRMLAESGCAWAASSEAVLANSLRSIGRDAADKAKFLYQPYVFADLKLLFRDDRLSDLIGFEYARWHGKDASKHFVAELETIARAFPGADPPIVSVMLDGENAWEYYPYNGYYFFEDLYGALEQHASIRTVTPADVLERRAEPLERIVEGDEIDRVEAAFAKGPEEEGGH